MFFIIISVSIQTVTRDSAAIETIPDFFARNVESIFEDIGTPPNLSNAMRLAAELEWSINIRNPIMRWSSDGDNRPKPAHFWVGANHTANIVRIEPLD